VLVEMQEQVHQLLDEIHSGPLPREINRKLPEPG